MSGSYAAREPYQGSGATAMPGIYTRSRGRRAAIGLAVLALFAICVGLPLAALRAVPDVVPAEASPLVFSAERAMADLRVIAATPRPTGSTANTAIRDYLVAEITALGLEPVVHAGRAWRHSPGFPEAHLTVVENVMARVPGANPGGKALLVSGHYDSVISSAGASDCGMCTVTALETLRAVVAARDAGQPLVNDVIFLFTDAEELGVAGAEAFMNEHPWAADVGLSLVFEGLGSDGAPLLYISRPGSGALTAEALDVLGEETRYPLAGSFLHDFMWTVAGNTGSDLDAFAEGAPGLAFIYLSLETIASYHSPSDNLAQLDPRSLQGMGDFSLALTRHFGNRRLEVVTSSPDLIAFPIAPGVVARYSGGLAAPLAAVASIFLLAALFVAWRRGTVSLKAALAAFAAWVPLMLTAVAVVSLVWWLVRLVSPGLHNLTVGGWWGSGFFLVASLLLALAIGVLWRALLHRFSPLELTAGWLGWFAVISYVTALAVPGMSYLFVWPLLVAGVSWLIMGLLPKREGWGVLAVIVTAAVALLLAAPVAVWMWIYTGRAEAMMGLPMAALPVVFVLPALLLALAAVEATVAGGATLPRRRWTATALLLTLVAVALYAAPAFMRPSAERPWANTVIYTLDADQGQAHWVTVNDSRAGRGVRHQLDGWTSQFFAAGAEETTFDPWLLTRSDTPYPALRAVAPFVDLPRTHIAVDGQGPVTHLTVTRPAEAWLTRLVVRSASPLTGIVFDGRPLNLGGTQPTAYTFLVFGRDDVVTLDLTRTGGVLSIDALDRLTTPVTDVAAQAGLSIAPRPAWMMTAAAADTADGALITGHHLLEE